MQKKLAVLFLVIMLALIGLTARLTYINVESGDKYTKQVLSQQRYDSQAIPFRRGDITDAKGTVLATSQKVYNVILDCQVVNTKKDYIEPTIAALTSSFGLSDADLRTILTDNKDSRYVVLLKKLSYEEIQPFIEMQNAVDEKTKNKVNPNIKGVWFEDEYLRSYPYNTLASSVLGFTVSGNVGNWGIEQYYNDELNGVDGREYGYLNDDAELERTIKPATDGNTIVSTIDATIQKVVEDQMIAFNEQYRGNYRKDDAGSKSISVIVANPNDGSILAMASSANRYDLNNPRDLTAYFTQEQIDAMDDETKLNNLNQIWKNSNITDTYEPGSTAKPMTVAAALDCGAITGNETYVCNKVHMVAGTTIKCNAIHGTVSVERAIMKSCNVALMEIGDALGKENFAKYQSVFGIGKKTGIDLPGEESGLIHSLDNMGPVDLATNSFGQNFNVTMVQMVSAFSSIINGGYYYKPHVVSKILDPSGATVSTVEPVLLKQTISKSTSDKLKEYLYKTVCDDEGTGKSARVPGYTMGGKTGTAEKVRDPKEAEAEETPLVDGATATRDKTNYIVSFIGYVPQENPQVVIYVKIDEPNLEHQYSGGSKLAQEVAKGILEEILPYLNIFPTEEVPSTDTENTSGAIQDATAQTNTTGEATTQTETTDGATTSGTTDTQTTGTEEVTVDSTDEPYPYSPGNQTDTSADDTAQD